MRHLTLINIEKKLCLNKLHVSDKSSITQSKNKPSYALKWPMCDFEKQGSHLIITIKTGFCVKCVRKCVYYGFWNTVVDFHDIFVRYGPPKHFRFTKSSGNLEILTSIFTCHSDFYTHLLGISSYELVIIA